MLSSWNRGALCVLLSLGWLQAAVEVDVDWPAYLAKQDPQWVRLPAKWEEGAFTGNGLLGTIIYTKGKDGGLDFQLGRSDVMWKNSRIPLGDLHLATVGKITAASLRLDLWQAEVTGLLTTAAGTIRFRTFTHSDQLVQVIETETTGTEHATWTWLPAAAADQRKIYKKEKLEAVDSCPPAQAEHEGEVQVSLQPLTPGGQHVAAWQIVPGAGTAQVLYASIGYRAPTTGTNDARADAVQAVRTAANTGFAPLLASHRAWWQRFWPQSFVAIPDGRLESFYWLQFYKMASATRPDRPALDLMGPWWRTSPWNRIWWNLNIQLAYWPQLTGNRLELGESLFRMLDANAANLAANAKEFSADSAAIGRTSAYDCRGPVGSELCNLPWTMHNYWLHYRYQMDEAMLRTRIIPLLKRSITYYLHLLKEGPDGKLHIPAGLSPEYPDQPVPNPDCNIDLSLLRWGLQTLIDTDQRLALADPDAPRWRETLTKLVPYPRDEHGLRISAGVPFAKSHRHYSHLLMVYPLSIMTPEQPENRDLVVTSLKHWMSMPKALEGYSYTGASSISSLLGEGDESLRYLNRLLDTKIPPNTLYVEAGPCIETPLSAAASLNDMLLSSWGDRIRVFPGIPAAWKEVAFHDLRTQGAFLLSAARHDGATAWVRIRSLAGAPCRIRPGLPGEVRCTVPFKPAGEGAYDLTLAKGEEAIFYPGTQLPECRVAPVPVLGTDPRPVYGVPRN